ncbi:MAG TPA: flavodoxin domain-containing protein [Candidatus Limnocylindrales bacterium]|nr:flavodoxin domain-containing protein [Candidatus Limnocylindrales bacterium]
MTKVQIVYGSRHGGTRGIAERIGEVLEANGIGTSVEPAGSATAATDADAYVVGSGVYMGSWLDEPLGFLARNQGILAARPVWLFSSGPLPGSTKEKPAEDPLENALGPLEGPGSGGRKKIDALSSATGVRDHRVFLGTFDPKDPPKAMSERIVRMMPAAKGMLPEGDFRDWPAIEAWAREIAQALTPVRSPVASV